MILKKIIEYRVQVLRFNGTQDTGILEDCDGHWLKLRKENDAISYIPFAAIRLVKLLS